MFLTRILCFTLFLLSHLRYNNHMAAATVAAASTSRHVKLRNDSSNTVKVFWLHPNTKEQVPFQEVMTGSHLSIQSFVNHTFIVRQTNNETHGSREGYITVGKAQEQDVSVKENLKVQYNGALDASSPAVASAIVEKCSKKLPSLPEDPSQAMDDILSCYETELAKVLFDMNEQIAFEAKMRTHVGEMLEDYVCADQSLPTTTAKDVRKWTSENDGGVEHDVHVLHERHDSQIHLVKNMISREECEAFQAAATRTLHRGTVADGKGGSQISKNRKAWQAGIRVPWEREADGDLLARYTRRMYDYANHATGYDMNVEGQEDIMSIQYFGQDTENPDGSSFDPEAPDRYMPHCDGDCTALPHKHGSRVATMVAYCTVPTKGGATNFQNAGVHVKPEAGSAAFFSYMDPETKVMDEAWTTHSGCPVVEGTKRIVVHWMRVGVSKDEPWNSFNTLNIPISVVEDQ